MDDSSGTPTTISNDVTQFTISTPRALQDVTGVDKSAIERIQLLADGTVSLQGVFNAATSHLIFSSITTSAQVRTTKITPTSNSTPYLSMELLFSDYQVSRSSAGELTWTAPGSLADGTTPQWTNS